MRDDYEMYVCLCADKVESEIHAAIDRGATTMEELMDELDVGTGCGTCRGMLQRMIQQKVSPSS